MKILVVDDERTFTFSENDKVVYARSIIEAREFLLNEHWDQVWLDHDMGENNGGDVSVLVNELEASENKYDVDMFYIHTMNIVRRLPMWLALKNAGYNARIVPASVLVKEK